MSPSRLAVTTPAAPAAIGPYSQAVRSGPFLFASGQVALDPGTGALVPGGIEAETHQVLKNLSAILEAAGSSLGAVVKTTVYMVDLGEFEMMNAVYRAYFADPAPARATIQAARLPRQARVEIDLIAAL